MACPHARACFFLKDRERLKSARVILSNHALTLNDVVSRRERSALLADCGLAVFDEAHHLDRVASEQLGIRLGVQDFEHAMAPLMDAKSGKGLARRLGFPAGLAEALREARLLGSALFEEAQAHLKAKGSQAAEVEEGHWGSGLPQSLVTAASILNTAAESIGDQALAMEARSQSQHLSSIAESLGHWSERQDPGEVYWVETAGRKGGTVLRSAPLEPGQALATELYPRFKAMVFSSATLATHKGLDFARKRLGLGEDCRCLILGSPFDYRRQVELHLSRRLPDPKADEPGFLDGIENGIREALENSGGRAFVLFTSFRHLEALAARLKEWIGEKGWLFLKQEPSRSKEALLNRFREAGNAVLFGAASFWEGVDVQGEALSCVILCRLPFSPPDSPLDKARARAIEAKGGRPFFELALPEAVLRLKQGFGRLIRHENDKGFVYILDSRVLASGYGKAFLKALPPCRTFVDAVEQEEVAYYTGTALEEA
jgi:ATP-dependent DNA helicase DinG